MKQIREHDIFIRNDGIVLRVDKIDELLYHYTVIIGNAVWIAGCDSCDFLSNCSDLDIVKEPQKHFYEELLMLIKL